MINYNDKKFKSVSNTNNGETSHETIFHYKQTGSILTACYSGGKIAKGHLIGIVNEIGAIEMHYHQINNDNEIMTGICHSTPEMMGNGKIRLHEDWKWTSGDKTRGNSILEEI